MEYTVSAEIQMFVASKMQTNKMQNHRKGQICPARVPGVSETLPSPSASTQPTQTGLNRHSPGEEGGGERNGTGGEVILLIHTQNSGREM